MTAPDSANGGHLAADELVDYFSMRLDAERERAIELHLAECHDCGEEARQIAALTARLRQSTAVGLGNAYRRSRSAVSEGHLSPAIGRDPRQRLQDELARLTWLHAVTVLAFMNVRVKRVSSRPRTGGAAAPAFAPMEWAADAEERRVGTPAWVRVPDTRWRIRKPGAEWILDVRSHAKAWAEAPLRFALDDGRSGTRWADGWLILHADAATAGYAGSARLKTTLPVPQSLQAQMVLCGLNLTTRPDLDALRDAVHNALDAGDRQAWQDWAESLSPDARAYIFG